MRALYLGLAALFCVLALATTLFDLSRILAVVSIIIAGIFLVLGLRITAERRSLGGPAAIELDPEQEEQIRTMLAEGRDGAAISQVQLWFRNTTPDQAREAVAQLRGGGPR